MAEPARARFEVVTAEEMPDDRATVCVEREGMWILCVREGEISPRCLAEINRLLDHITSTGQWLQNWPHHRPDTPQQRRAG